MYWNTINNGCYEFTKKFHYAPDVIYMNRDTYNKLEAEMYGVQLLAMQKHNSVRGLKIFVDYNLPNDIIYIICGKDGDCVVGK